MKMVKKVIFWILIVLTVMFIGCMALATASRMHVGEEFGPALLGGFCDTADGVGELIGIHERVQPDWEFSFKNGNISFGNTHITW